MTVRRYRTRKNEGYGKTGEHAMKGAFIEQHQGGHYGTVKTHMRRASKFLRFVHERYGIRDLSRQDMTPFIHAYAAHVAAAVAEGRWRQTYGINLLSTVNRLFAAMGLGDKYFISPESYLGKRCQIRSKVPDGMDRECVEAAIKALRGQGYERVVSVVELAATFGVRFREASLGDLLDWHREAIARGEVNVRKGTKGGRGRKVPRWVRVDADGMAVLRRALAARPLGSRSLLRPGEPFNKFRDGEAKRSRAILKRHGIKNFRELRAAYACNTYAALTGSPAPVLTGGTPTATREEDLRAREILSQELGHNRVDVVGAYIGGRARPKCE